jgi:hypothetical protein
MQQLDIQVINDVPDWTCVMEGVRLLAEDCPMYFIDICRTIKNLYTSTDSLKYIRSTLRFFNTDKQQILQINGFNPLHTFNYYPKKIPDDIISTYSFYEYVNVVNTTESNPTFSDNLVFNEDGSIDLIRLKKSVSDLERETFYDLEPMKQFIERMHGLFTITYVRSLLLDCNGVTLLLNGKPSGHNIMCTTYDSMKSEKQKRNEKEMDDIKHMEVKRNSSFIDRTLSIAVYLSGMSSLVTGVSGTILIGGGISIQLGYQMSIFIYVTVFLMFLVTTALLYAIIRLIRPIIGSSKYPKLLSYHDSWVV